MLAQLGGTKIIPDLGLAGPDRESRDPDGAVCGVIEMARQQD